MSERPDQMIENRQPLPCFAWGLCCVRLAENGPQLSYIVPGLSAVLDGVAAGTALGELVYPEDLPLLECTFAEGEEISMRLRILQKAGGEPLPVQFTGVRQGQDIWGVVSPAGSPLSEQYQRLQEWFGGFRTLLRATSQQAYEWDIRSGNLQEAGYQSIFWREMMRAEPLLAVDEDGLPSAQNIYPPDQHAFRQLHESVREGGAGGTIELRMRTGYGVYRWCRLTLNTLYNEAGSPMKAVGLLSDIEYEKRAAIAMEMRAQKDGLTGIYNGEAFRERMEAELLRRSGTRMVFCTLQIDSYPQLLARLGWIQTRGFLVHAATRLVQLAGPDATVGRIGERTFGLLLPVRSAKQAAEFAAQCCKELRQSVDEGMQKISSTASVGYVVVPPKGAEMADVLHAADLALGKATATGDIVVAYTKALVGGPVAGLRIHGVEDSGDFDDNLLFTFFERLYQDQDADRAVSQVLMMAGEHYNASRAFVYQVDEEDPSLCHLLFDWCAQGIEPLRPTERVSDLMPIQEEPFTDGKFLCEEVDALPENLQRLLKKRKVQMVFQVGAYQDGVLRAIIGFHSCARTRLWNSNEKQSLALTAKLLGPFLLRVYYKERARRRDPLTGLPLYGQFRQTAARRLLAAEDASWQLLMLDVVRFRDINELFGTNVGDQILLRFARQLRMKLTDGELACRLTANRYALLLRRKPGVSARDRIEMLMMSFEPIRLSLIGTHSFNLVTGVVDAVAEEPVDTLMEKAKIACRKAKESGVPVVYYGAEQSRMYALRQKIEENQQDALKNKEFELYLQPKYAAADHAVTGARAWVRWNNRSAGQLLTSQFLPVFQENGFVLDLDYELIDQICGALASWPEKRQVPVSLRIDRLHFAMSDFIPRLCAICEKHRVPRSLVCLEVPENVFTGDKVRLARTMRELKRQGFLLLLGGFGSGWSSLDTLTGYPFDALRLDSSFFGPDAGKKKLIAESICKMASTLGLRLSAEDVQTEEQADFLRSIGVDELQGDLYTTTLSAEEFRRSIIDHKG